MALKVVDPVRFLGFDPEYYWHLHETNVVEWFKPLFSRGWTLRSSDGKLVPPKPHQLPFSPWHYIKIAFDCIIQQVIMFETVGRVTNRTFIPSRCQACYKVVIEPRTLIELFALEHAMKTMPVAACKCGIEVRDFVPRLYGGYVYGVGPEQGQRNYELVRRRVSAHPLLGSDVPVYLKRGCTEMEQKGGPSDQWKCTEKQRTIEKWIEAHIAITPDFAPQAPHVKRAMHYRWIRFAWAHGDRESAEMFTGGRPIEEPYVMYQDAETGDQAGPAAILEPAKAEPEPFDLSETIAEEIVPFLLPDDVFAVGKTAPREPVVHELQGHITLPRGAGRGGSDG